MFIHILLSTSPVPEQQASILRLLAVGKAVQKATRPSGDNIESNEKGLARPEVQLFVSREI
jgi:hypothetical protein